jgi:hypothetical protein
VTAKDGKWAEPRTVLEALSQTRDHPGLSFVEHGDPGYARRETLVSDGTESFAFHRSCVRGQILAVLLSDILPLHWPDLRHNSYDRWRLAPDGRAHNLFAVVLARGQQESSPRQAVKPQTGSAAELVAVATDITKIRLGIARNSCRHATRSRSLSQQHQVECIKTRGRQPCLLRCSAQYPWRTSR